MSSKSSNKGGAALPIGPIAGFRGARGEMTIRVPSGHPERWTGLTRVWVGREAGDPAREEFRVEAARAYRDRLVLKLEGLDTPGEVEARRGRWILAPPDEVPELPAGTYYVERLRGLRVEDVRRGPLGRVADFVETGGADLLVVEGEGGRELLIPFAGTIVLEVREDLGTIRVDLPEGLAEEQA